MILCVQCIIINVGVKFEEYLFLIIELVYLCFLVYGDLSDDIIGILLVKDLLDLVYKGKLEKMSLKDLICFVILVFESKCLNVLFKDFCQFCIYMVIVVNEYGKMFGLVMIEDVFEQIVGEIDDEYDFDDEYMIK